MQFRLDLDSKILKASQTVNSLTYQTSQFVVWYALLHSNDEFWILIQCIYVSIGFH